ncbi:alpha/beta hydrolase [Streptomyces sp. NY05-11A]|uniref:alpha/beta hydrolase n=1 Tax=Streptomyces soliscabiei TaxID=588897 RepID=UPI0029B1B8CA|nr:alpha/beta hydrolase [Streptomyces sp. NY05-11A]MDX2681450.1 alpha/beta hydrolase [Streptomyces sp. NY05-11A]
MHGAFIDASSWARVISLLHAAGLTVRALANPLRGLAQDAAYIRSMVRHLDVPVVLVGHGYGGAVITHAATDADNIVALCYVAAFGLDAGECVVDITNRFAPMPVTDATVTVALPGRFPADPDSELYVRKERFPQVYAADLPPRVTDVLSVTQRPIAWSALTGRSGQPAWASKPSWYAIATADRMLSPRAQCFMAQRMAATEHLLDGSHAVVLSQPGAVAAMIREAAEQCTGRGDGDGFRRTL